MLKGIILLFIFLRSFVLYAQDDFNTLSCQNATPSIDQILQSDVNDLSKGLEQYMNNQNCDPYFLATQDAELDKKNFIKYIRQVARVEDRRFIKYLESCDEKYISSLLIDRMFKNSNIQHCDYLIPTFSKLQRSDLDLIVQSFKPELLSLEKPKLKSLKQHEQWEMLISPLVWWQNVRNTSPGVFVLPVNHAILAHRTDTMSNFNWMLKQNINYLIDNNSIQRGCAEDIPNKITSCHDMGNQIEAYQKGVIACQNLKIADLALFEWNKQQEELKNYLATLSDITMTKTLLDDFQQQFNQCYQELKTNRQANCLEALAKKRNTLFLKSIMQEQQSLIEKMSPQHAALVNQYNLDEKIEKKCSDLSNLYKIKDCQNQLSHEFLQQNLYARLIDFKIPHADQTLVNESWQKCGMNDQRCQIMALSYVKLPAKVYNEDDRQAWVEEFISQNPIHNLNDQIKLVDVLLHKKVDVIEVDYKVNRGATYCKRPMDAVDTIVIHHTATSENETPERINEGHLNRSPDDPWLMIGYHYLITQKSQRHGVTPKIYRGRPDNYVGAHAGGEAISREYPASLKNKLMTKKINCGKYPGVLHKVDPTLDENGNTRANDTTLAISFIGNFAAFDAVLNPTGYRPINKVVYPSDESLRETAQLICQLKGKYPSINKLGYHQQYKATSCPGSVKLVLNKIKSFAKEYGCSLNLQN